MANGDGQPKALGIILEADHIELELHGRRHVLDPAASVALALQLTHWLIERIVRHFKISPLITPPH